MAEISKPDYRNIWASGGAVVYPSNTKWATGWTSEVPPFQWENAIQNRQDLMLAHINQHGIPRWDALTEYFAGQSYVLGSDGFVYKSVAASSPTTTTQDPTTDASDTYWKLAFAEPGQFITQATGDTRYLQRANNGSDISNAATFRSNIGVVDSTEAAKGLIQIATAAQATAGTSDSTAITPLKLSQQLTNAASSSFARQRLWIRDQKTLGTNGGSLTLGGWRTRDLQTIVLNQITGASLTANQITLPAGTYFIIGDARIGDVADTRLRLFNITNSTLALESMGLAGVKTGNLAAGKTPIMGSFTLSATSALELQIWSSASSANTGNGYPLNIGTNEVFADLSIWKI